MKDIAVRVWETACGDSGFYLADGKLITGYHSSMCDKLYSRVGCEPHKEPIICTGAELVEALLLLKQEKYNDC